MTLPQSITQCGFGSAVAIFPAALRSREICLTRSALEKPLAVVLENEGVEFRQDFAQAGHDLGDLRIRRIANLFPIDADDLLMAGDDARFHDGAEIGIGHDEAGVDFLRA